MTAPLSLGEQLGEFSRRMDAATAAWAQAGYPYDGPVYEAREQVFADLRAWTASVTEGKR